MFAIRPVVIKLNHDQETIIDSDDLERISGYKWRAQLNTNNKYYVFATIGNKNVQLANFIMNHDPKNDMKLTVDHIDRDPLNNRKYNLRMVTKTIQAINRDVSDNTHTRVKGVSYEKSRRRFKVTCQENGIRKTKSFFISVYGTKDEAFKAAVEFRLMKENSIPEYIEALCYQNNNNNNHIKNESLNDIERINRQSLLLNSKHNKTGKRGIW